LVIGFCVFWAGLDRRLRELSAGTSQTGNPDWYHCSGSKTNNRIQSDVRFVG
jgi:hypothetical protein